MWLRPAQRLSHKGTRGEGLIEEEVVQQEVADFPICQHRSDTYGEKTFKDLFKQWLKHKIITLVPPKREPTIDDKAHTKYCEFQKYFEHPTIECYNVRRIYYNKVANGEIKISK